MLPPFKSLPVNWLDGMKINKDHLIHTDNYFSDLVRDTIALQINDFNYGLLTSIEEGISNLSCNITVDPAKVIRVNLHSCRAITPGGGRIEFGFNTAIKSNTDVDGLVASYNFDDTREKNFYVVLGINSLARIPIGQQDANENPPRIPYVMPEYFLQILPESQINLNDPPHFSLIVGCLNYANGKMRVNENFIPACTMLKCSTKLLDDYYRLGNLLGETGKNIAIIIDKIHSKSQSTQLVKACLKFCNSVATYIANDLGTYRWLFANQPPIYMLESFLRLAYRVNITLTNIPVKDKEELVSYICEWVEESPSELNEKINRVIRSEYNHTNISSTLQTADEFIQLIHTIFAKLAQLDFIGKKKGERAFVQERPTVKEVEEPKPEQKKGWSFLAE